MLDRIREACKNRINAVAVAMIPELPVSRVDVNGAYVIWKRQHETFLEYGTHFYNDDDGGLHLGHYRLKDFDAAMADVAQRAGRPVADMEQWIMKYVED